MRSGVIPDIITRRFILLLYGKFNRFDLFYLQTKMGGSRSGSVQSFDDALREATANQGGATEGGPRPNGTPTPVATPVTTDEKPLS